MSLLDKASLIVTPNAYKESKLYSVVPSSGAGDMDVVRATTATRVNSAGLIEVVPRNLQKYSEQFDNAYYDKSNCSITSNSIAAPNGTMTADKLIMSNGQSGSSADGTGIRVLEDIASNGYIYSIYAKAGEFSTLRFRENQVTGAFLTINLNNGVITNGDTNQYINPTAELITNGWYRVSFKAPIATALYKYSVRVSETGNGTSGIYIWGYQVEYSASLTEYFPTTTRLNIPRIDYTNGSCPSLLVEPQRTNISSYVESGTGSFNSATVASATNILGLKAFKVTTDIGTYGDVPNINTNSQFQANTAYTISFYTDFSKCTGTSITASFLGLFIGVSYAGITVNKTTKAITTFNIGTNWTLNTYSATQINGQIYRISLTATPNATAIDLSRNYIYTDNLFAIEVSGIQVEVGSYSTSFINKPSSASVTRNSDVISKTGISSLIGQTQGTVFFDAIINTNNEAADIITIINQSNVLLGAYVLGYNISGNITLYTFPSGSLSILKNGDNRNNRIKLAFAYSNNDFIVFVNGIQTFSSSSLLLANGLSTLFVNSNNIPANWGIGNYNSVQLYKTRLTNTELAQLTTI